MIHRKYTAEGGLELYSSGATVIKPVDIYRCGKDENIRKALLGCNIYIIARRHRISISPDTLKFQNRKIQGDFLVHDGFEYERFPFTCNQVLPPSVSSVLALDFPKDGIAYQGLNGESTKMPTFRFMADCKYDLEGNDDLEVLYVGKGYGKEGEVLAIDRLQKHSTLQRILADTLNEKPDNEILLLLFRYEHYKKHSSTAGDFSIEPTATIEEDSEYFQTVMEAEFTRKNRVLLAEAGLIRYFKPQYNEIYKETFPSKKHKILEELLELDFSALTVQVDTSNIRVNLFSHKAPPETGSFAKFAPYVHIAKIPLYSKEERESFLHDYL